MKTKVIKLNESMLESLVKKILKEEGEQPKQEKKSTVTRHPAYPIIDKLEGALDQLKTEFKRDIANKVSGEDGYHSEIDKFNSDFNKFIGKVSDLKGKINDYTISSANERKMKQQKQMEEMKRLQHEEREKAYKEGKKYYYGK